MQEISSLFRIFVFLSKLKNLRYALSVLLLFVFGQFMLLPSLCTLSDAKAEYIFYTSGSSEEESHGSKSPTEEVHFFAQMLFQQQSAFLSDSTQSFLLTQVLADYEVNLSLFVPPPEVC